MAAEYSLTVGGVEREVLLPSLDVAWVINGLDTLTCSIGSLNAAYRPAVRDEVVLSADGTPIFGGIITQAPEESWGGPALADIQTRISATSFDIFASYRYVTETLAAGTLKSQLQTLVPYLSTHGVTLHGSQVDGPSVPELVVTRQRLDNILNRLSELTGYTWRIDPSKVLRMALPSAAPFDILDTGDVHQVGDVSVERTLDDTYANRVILSVTGAGPATSTETFVAADGVSGGSPSETRFTAKYPASQSINDAYPNVLVVDGTARTVIGFGPTQLPAGTNWYWDYTVSPAQLVYPDGSGQFFPTGAEVISITYAIGYPFEITAENATDIATYGIREALISVAEAMPLEAAQELADMLVDEVSAVLTKVRYDTLDEGIRPGMSQTVTVAKRDVDDGFVVQDVRMSWDTDADNETMRYAVTLASGRGVKGNFRDTYKAWLGGSTQGAALAATGGGGGAAFPPERAVQSYKEGALYGSSQLLADHDKTGATYQGDRATLAVLPLDDTRWAQVWRNQSATAGSLLGVLHDSGDDFYWYSYGNDWYFVNNSRDLSVQAARIVALSGTSGITASVGNVSSASVDVRAVLSSYGLALRTQRHTGTSATVDSSSSSAPSIHIIDGSGAFTLNLPALASFRVTPSTDQQRVLWVVNDSPTHAATIDPNSSESVFVRGVAQSTLVLHPGQSVCLSAWNGTDAGWKVVSPYHPTSAALGTGAVAGLQHHVGRNSSGSGAAGTLVLYSAAGTPHYLWVDATGDLRIHTAAPTEDGTTVSDTAGTVVGAQS